ncbi:MAG: 30S ribosome-binding factor RbfA [Phycisphaeraceae bacterium]
MTHRIEQVESTLRKALAQVLQRRISDPRIRGMVSITEIDLTTDMKQAKVLVSVLPEEYAKRTLAGLKAANRHIHSEVKKLVAIRIVPHLRFELDDSLKQADQVFQAIDDAKAREASNQDSSEDEADNDEA